MQIQTENITVGPIIVKLKAAGHFKFRSISIEEKCTGRKEGTYRCLRTVKFHESLK
jgi:hypothetical protein